jgi:hypothetical protein
VSIVYGALGLLKENGLLPYLETASEGGGTGGVNAGGGGSAQRWSELNRVDTRLTLKYTGTFEKRCRDVETIRAGKAAG